MSERKQHGLSRLGHAPIQRIVIVRALPGLGDMLCAVPALRCLRTSFPDAHIALLGLRWARRFVRRFHRYLDDFLEFPGFPGLTPAAPVERIPRFLGRVQEKRYDLALQMHGSGVSSNLLALLLGARVTCGFYPQGGYCPDSNRFLPYPKGEPEVLRNIRLMEFLGLRPEGEQLEFPLLEEDWKDFRALDRARKLKAGEYVCVHPGARAASRRWLPERFASVGAALVRRGYQVVITGSEEEKELAADVGRRMGCPHVNLAGPMSLGAVAVLLSGARLVVSNDTGISHLAAALRVPSVVVFTAADPARWAPLNRDLHRVVMAAVDCRPCEYQDCPIGHPCAELVKVETVLEQAEELLRKEYHHAAA